MTMNGDPRNPDSRLPSGGTAEGAPQADPRADLEQDLRADLEAVGAAWSALAQEQPPDLLDQAVLNAARRAVAEPGQPVRRPLRLAVDWPLRWLGAFATAAVVVLAVTVALEHVHEAPVPTPPASDGYKLERSAASQKLQAEPDQDAARTESAETQNAQQSLQDRTAPGRELSMPAAAAPSAPAPAADLEQDLAEPGSEASPPSPEEWIERLRNVKSGGDPAAFEVELAAFRATYPAYPLPPELLE